jgi:membrane protein DedA with SNARE-associated domain
MDILIGWISAAVAAVGSYKYPALFLGSIVEGPILTVLTGFLARIGTFSWFPAYLVLVAGDLAGDVIWYAIGRYGAGPLAVRYGHIFNITPEGTERARVLYRDHHNKIIFTSKITMGFGFALATLMTAGAVKVPLGRFVLMNFLGGIVWTGILFGLGYFFGNVYYQVAKEFKILSLVASTVFVSVVVYGFSAYMRKRYSKK